MSDPKCYTTFIRSCRNWREFSTAEKEVQDTDLTFTEAKEACREFNSNLTERQQEAGTKMEFTCEDL